MVNDMSSPDIAYAMHTHETIGYDRPRRSISQIRPALVSEEADALQRTSDVRRANDARRNLAVLLGVPLDAFIGEHGAIDDVALVRTARYAARSARRSRQEE